MKAQKLANQYLQKRHTMQLATQGESGLWICTVRFVADALHNLYWASLPTRLHSQHIEQQPSVAATIVVHNVIGEPVIAVQLKGQAKRLHLADYDSEIVGKYAAKFMAGKEQWVEDFMTDQTEHRLYRLTPSEVYLFDEENFPGGKRVKVDY